MIVVSDITRQPSEGGAELRATVTVEEAGRDRRVVWLRYPAELSDRLSQTANPFVPALLLPAMNLGTALKLEGPVSTRTLSGARKFMTIMHRWRPEYRPVEIQAEDVAESPIPGEAIGSFFSGGVDSFYTVLKNQHAANLPGAERISHLLFIRGFDIGLGGADDRLYDRALECVRAAAAALGKDVIRVATNLKEALEPLADWNMYYGQALASVALGLEGFLRRVYIPAGHTFVDAPPRGSHALLDPLWGTGSLELIHDGGEATRVEKVVWEVGRSPVALEHLRVCWENLEGAYNCGRCEKCIRTMVNLTVAGALDRCQTFDRELDLFEIAHLPIHDANDRTFVEENYEALAARGGDPELLRALETSLSRWARWRPRALVHRLPPGLARAVVRFVWGADRALLGGRLKRWYKRPRR